jgi:hypothetical protein
VMVKGEIATTGYLTVNYNIGSVLVRCYGTVKLLNSKHIDSTIR